MPTRGRPRRLNDAQELEILHKIQNGATEQALALEYFVSRPTIKSAVKRQTTPRKDVNEDQGNLSRTDAEGQV